MKATATPVRELDSNTYQCRRCGIRKLFGGSAPARPELCRDCRDVLAYREPDPPKPAPPPPPPPPLAHLTDAECLAGRNAMRRGDRSPEAEAAAREYWRRAGVKKRTESREAS